jgi:hypothetical protein
MGVSEAGSELVEFCTTVSLQILAMLLWQYVAKFETINSLAIDVSKKEDCFRWFATGNDERSKLL